MANGENTTMYCFKRDGKQFGIRCELTNFFDSWKDTYSYKVEFRLFVDGVERKFDPSPDYVPINNGRGIENWLTNDEYQKKIRKLYPDECEEAKRLFLNEYFSQQIV